MWDRRQVHRDVGEHRLVRQVGARYDAYAARPGAGRYVGEQVVVGAVVIAVAFEAVLPHRFEAELSAVHLVPQGERRVP